MTTDLGFAHLRLPAPAGSRQHFQVGFIDVPGHGKFLKNMIAGVGALDMALLVVAADEGPMPQTLQHMEILSLLGVSKVLLVINKCDLANEDLVRARIAEVSNLLGKYDLEVTEAVSTSCFSDTGFDQLKLAIARSLANAQSRTLSSLKQLPAFLPIDRAFSIVGHGLVVTGTLVRGSVRQGDSVTIEPLGAKARVRGLETFGNSIQIAYPGQRLAINLAVKEHENIKRGQAIVGAPVNGTKTLLVSLDLFADQETAPKNFDIRPQPVKFYHGTAEIKGFLGWVQELSGISAGHRHRLLGQITLEEPVIAEPGERFVDRIGEEELAGGAILLKARPKWLVRSLLTEFCQLLMERRWEDAVQWFAEHCPQSIFRKDNLALFLPLESRESIVRAMVESRRLLENGDFILTEKSYADLQNRILEKLTVLENVSTTKQASVTLEALRMAVHPPPDRAIFASAVEVLAKRGDLVKDGEKLFSRAAQRQVQSVTASPQTITDVEAILAKNVCIEVDALPTLCRAKATEIERAVQYLEKQNKAKRIAHDFISSTDALESAHAVLAVLWKEKQQITPSEFKERMNITRKYAMAMLSHFDDNQITRRVGTGRVLLKTPKT